MKKLLYILTALLIVATVAGCNKEKSPSSKSIDITGEWHCIPAEFDAEVYVAFLEGGMFDLYQRVGEGRYRHFTGTWWMDGKTLSGNYADNTPWGSDYNVTLNGTESMTLTATNGSGEIMTYTKESIPTEVKSECVEVRSTTTDDLPLL